MLVLSAAFLHLIFFTDFLHTLHRVYYTTWYRSLQISSQTLISPEILPDIIFCNYCVVTFHSGPEKNCTKSNSLSFCNRLQ